MPINDTWKYSGTSLIRSHVGRGKNDLNGEVIVYRGLNCTVEYNLGLRKGYPNVEVTLVVR